MADGKTDNQNMGLTPRISLRDAWIRGLAVAGLALVVSGCGWWSGEDRKVIAKRGCPNVGILSDARMKTDYREGSGRDITDIAYRWEFLDAATVCSYDDSVVSVDYALSMSVNVGPAATRATAAAPFFVALTKGGETIQDKTIFQAEIEFAPGERSTIYTRTFEDMEFDVGEDDGGIYEIIIGFQLTPEQVAENRRRSRF